jgi:hypothetical protein
MARSNLVRDAELLATRRLPWHHDLPMIGFWAAVVVVVIIGWATR